MTEFVKIIEDVPLVSTLDMWKELGVEHKALMQTIRKSESYFQQIRPFEFLKSKTTRGAGRPITFCYLNEEQLTFLVTLTKNSEAVKEYKFRLTKEFYKAKRILAVIAFPASKRIMAGDSQHRKREAQS